MPEKKLFHKNTVRSVHFRALTRLFIPGRMTVFSICFFLAAGILLGGCDSAILSEIFSPPTQESTPSATQPAITLPAEQTTESQPTAKPDSQQLIIWLPPQFSPQTNSKAGSLLKARLDEFTQQNPEVKILIRTKALSGTGGLLDSLTSASSVAPSVVPSLIALSRSDLESAALKELIFPIDSYTPALDGTDWYAYAQSLSIVDNISYGLPFAGDALLLAYRPGKIGSPPEGWAGILERGQPVVFPAADPQGLVTMALYRSAGGKIKDDQGKPFLDPDTLSDVLNLYADGARQGGFPTWLSQYQTDAQAWQAYTGQNANWAVTWSSRYLTELPADTTAVPLPSLGDKDYSLATGWIWAVSDPYPEQRALAVKLAEFLVNGEFFSKWSSSLNYLPVRPSTMTNWTNQSQRASLEKIVQSAEVRPDSELSSILGPLFSNATLEVIKNQKEPVPVAQEAAENLYKP